MLQSMTIKTTSTKHKRFPQKASWNMRALQLMEIRQNKYGLVRCNESVVHVVPSGAAADKYQKYIFGSSKVVITMGPLGLQHELITQKICCRHFTNYRHHNTDVEEPARQSLQLNKTIPKSCHRHPKTFLQAAVLYHNEKVIDFKDLLASLSINIIMNRNHTLGKQVTSST